MSGMTEERRRNIGKALAERARRLEDENPSPVRGMKRCAKCGEMKPYDLEKPRNGEFSRRRQKFRLDGSFIWRPHSQCYACVRTCRKERWDAMTTEQKREAGLRMREQRDRDKEREYKRKHARMRRRLAGVPERGPWRRYQHELEDDGGVLMVDAGPFLEYLSALNGNRPAMRKHDEALQRTIYRIEHEGGKRIAAHHVDRFGVLTGHPELLRALYPNA